MFRFPATNVRLTLALLLVGFLAYGPGLRGPFLFDDWASLPALGASGRIHDIASFLRYVTSGTADPTGRPLALASFALNAHDWPANPLPFKLTNVAIHLVNALLLAILLTRLSAPTKIGRDRIRSVAWFAAAMWALHPFLVSTVLYVVQREALLVTTFAFLAMLAWLRARAAFARRERSAAIWLYAGTGGATLLALLCKANGVTIPLLVLAIEITLPPLSEDSAATYRRHACFALALPSTLLLGTLAWLAISSLGDAPLPARGWTLTQRLMTEPGILLDYLSRLWLVQPASGTFFHDQLTVVTSLLDPWYELLPLIICGVAMGTALALRRKQPMAAAAILFFFAGHTLESTSVPLELYFEHRNYLPSALMFWPLAAAIVDSRYDWLRRTLPTVLLTGLFWLTRTQAALWGNAVEQARVWATLQPNSPRAQTYAAGVEAAVGDWQSARQRIDIARQRFSNEPQVAVNLIDIHCVTGGVTPDDIAYAQQTFEKTPRDPGVLMTSWFESSIIRTNHVACAGMNWDVIYHLLAAASRNPVISRLPGRRQDIAHLYGTLSLQQGRPDHAAYWFDEALREEPKAKVALNEAALLGAAGRPDLGLRHLDLLEQLPPAPLPSMLNGMAWIHEHVLRSQNYWPNEIINLRAALDRAARQRSK